MQFSTAFFGIVAAAAAANAAKVTFKNLDGTTRQVVWTPAPGSADIPTTTVAGNSEVNVDVPDHYEGNFYALEEGAEDKPGMLGEVLFGGWNGFTYFDVSAIVDPTDKNNVKQMWPASGDGPTSGCENFPCNNAYYLPDDVQTKVTSSKHLITTLGGGN